MGKLRRTMLLALVALGAASVVPASASAAQWQYGGSPLTGKASVGLDGYMKWTSATGHTLQCGFDGEAELSPGSEGEITSFELGEHPIYEIPCFGTGAYGYCEVESFQALGLPWNFQATKAGVVASEHNVAIAFVPGTCTTELANPFKDSGAFTMTADDANAITSFSIPSASTKGGMSLTGSFDVTPAGVYGIK